ncbi:MAG: hypothetical protein Q8P05_02715 [Candidatus Diapherotrites archaeon]|nr:hypothetical protein [Candidatus Diapherotrites archaeon]MDZ4256739.1 hypothetical protein [archaeon]
MPIRSFFHVVKKAMQARRVRKKAMSPISDKRLYRLMMREFGNMHQAIKKNRRGNEHPIQTYARIQAMKQHWALRRAYAAAHVYGYETRKALLGGDGKPRGIKDLIPIIGERRAEAFTQTFRESMAIGGGMEERAFVEDAENQARNEEILPGSSPFRRKRAA